MKASRLSWVINSETQQIIGQIVYRPPHIARQKQDDQHEHTFSSYVRITVCSPEDLPEAMNDKEKWRERVRDIRASGTT